MKTTGKKEKEEEDDQPVDLQIRYESLATEHELLKHAFDDLDQDHKKLTKENEHLKKQVRPPSRPDYKPQEKPEKSGKIRENAGEKAADLVQANQELYEFLMKFRYRSEIKQAVYNLANSKEFHWLLDKYKPAPVEEPVPA